MAVHPVLEDEELGPELADERPYDPAEKRHERLVAGPRRERNVHLEAGPVPPSHLVRVAGPGEDRAAVLVEIDVQDAPVGVEPVHHPTAVVHVDVDVRDAPVLSGERGADRHRDVVEDTEAARAVRMRVVQPAPGLEGDARRPLLDRPKRGQRGADDPSRRLKAARERRSVPAVEVLTTPALVQPPDQLEVAGTVEPGEDGVFGRLHAIDPGRGRPRGPEQAGGEEEADRERAAGLRERMIRAEVVGAQPIVPNERERGRGHPAVRTLPPVMSSPTGRGSCL